MRFHEARDPYSSALPSRSSPSAPIDQLGWLKRLFGLRTRTFMASRPSKSRKGSAGGGEANPSRCRSLPSVPAIDLHDSRVFRVDGEQSRRLRPRNFGHEDVARRRPDIPCWQAPLSSVPCLHRLEALASNPQRSDDRSHYPIRRARARRFEQSAASGPAPVSMPVPVSASRTRSRWAFGIRNQQPISRLVPVSQVRQDERSTLLSAGQRNDIDTKHRDYAANEIERAFTDRAGGTENGDSPRLGFWLDFN